ncbi:MAG TPA: hypothetical protein VNW54_05185 [Granulicella sp.]|jgi:hypothetical protein|nr:hypothetical protein [Granulicella sp.]
MRTLSASEAIAPAVERTKAVLFQPFQIGRSWKLAATAYLAAMGGLFLPMPLTALLQHGHGSSLAAAAVAVVLRWIFGLLGAAVLFVLFYIGARLQFARFDIVLRGEKMVAPLWRRYAPVAWRWIGLKLALSAVFLALAAVPLALVLPQLTARLQVAPGQRPSPHLLLSLLLFEAVIGLAIFAMMFCSSLLDDFVLPSIALEGTPLGEALRRFGALIRSETGPFFFYLFFKALLAIACVIAMEIVILLSELLAFIPLGLLGALGWLLLHHLGPSGHILMLAGGVVLVLLFAVFAFYASLGMAGASVLFFQAYALYFLGGRYPLLGDLLEPPPPGFAYPAPPPLPGTPDPTPPQLPLLRPDAEAPSA